CWQELVSGGPVWPALASSIRRLVALELWPEHASTCQELPGTSNFADAPHAFTDYRSQGQTIPNVLVDIATPPTGGLSLFNLSSGRHSIRILRDFDDSIFMAAHDPELLAEDDRLEHMDRQTRKWWGKMQDGC
ncbi:hypothetical protein H0H92_015239, partial [Tricholoma furcatifolium]